MKTEGTAAKVHLQVMSVGVKLVLVHCELGSYSCPPIQSVFLDTLSYRCHLT